MKKRIVALIMAFVMIMGSVSVVSAAYDSSYHEFSNGCSATYDIYCYSYGAGASTWIYVEGNINSIEAKADVTIYVLSEDNYYSNSIDYLTKDLMATQGGVDSASSSEINSGMVTADTEVTPGSGMCGWMADSTHEVRISASAGNANNIGTLSVH